MNRAEVELLLARVTYKPGWKIKLVDGGDFDGRIEVWFKGQDATRKRDGELILTMSTPIPPLYTFENERDFLRFLRSRVLLQAEQHEIDEWLQVDGVAPFYPH